jgi:hypothetical protein
MRASRMRGAGCVDEARGEDDDRRTLTRRWRRDPAHAVAYRGIHIPAVVPIVSTRHDSEEQQHRHYAQRVGWHAIASSSLGYRRIVGRIDARIATTEEAVVDGGVVFTPLLI